MLAKKREVVILGGGLAGLSAGHVLTRAGMPVVVIEADREIGGLAKTIEHEGFRFDLGGHRFLTNNRVIENFVAELLEKDLLETPRASKILLRGKYFDYPLRPANALLGLGVRTTVRVLADYCGEQLAAPFRRSSAVSLEDWVVRRFGRTMFELYFRDYSEKVWGIPCSEISAEWVSRRIAGLSLWNAVKNAFSKRSGRDIHTLADRFLYPSLGIGQISERLRNGIAARNAVLTDTAVLRVRHEEGTVRSVMVRNGNDLHDIEADEFVSSIPLTNLAHMLHPAPPEPVRKAALGLRFRDLVITAVMINAEQVTNLSWLYLPEKNISLGRIHEPKNWSPLMAPAGKTHLVAEYFCFRGDDTWNASDAELTDRTVKHLSGIGLFSPDEVIGSRVVRVPRAYPILDTGYRRKHEQIMDYLARFKNLHIAGRGGTFQYLNMDHAIESGIEAAERILRKPRSAAAKTRIEKEFQRSVLR